MHVKTIELAFSLKPNHLNKAILVAITLLFLTTKIKKLINTRSPWPEKCNMLSIMKE
jgi:hypothetical protein